LQVPCALDDFGTRFRELQEKSQMITGKIRTFNGSEAVGLIYGDDGMLYPFALREWLATFAPITDMAVRFKIVDGAAADVTVLSAEVAA
jgi:hypothetical protein